MGWEYYLMAYSMSCLEVKRIFVAEVPVVTVNRMRAFLRDFLRAVSSNTTCDSGHPKEAVLVFIVYSGISE